MRGSDRTDIAEIELAKFQVSPGEGKVSTRGEPIAVLTAGEETHVERCSRKRSAISRASFGINDTPSPKIERRSDTANRAHSWIRAVSTHVGQLLARKTSKRTSSIALLAIIAVAHRLLQEASAPRT